MTSASARPSSMPSGFDPVLDDVVEEIANRIQAGEPVDGEAILARYPDRADSILRLLPAMAVMAEFGISASRLAASGISPGLSPLTGELGTLGDFRILREVGRGGMGIVYEAEQMSLSRRVALKVLPLAAAMDPRQLQRFQLEAKAAACLHHTNIVPVHAVGCDRGVHYYAMQFIEGQTLAAIIEELRRFEAPVGWVKPTGPPAADGAGVEGIGGFHPPDSELASRLAGGDLAPADPAPPPATARTPSGPLSSTPMRSRAFFRTVADLGIQAAEAIEHAHGLGVVHRDIKPANILIDHRGTLWITDFGLARLRNDSGLTMTGDLMGTLRYMSPEQAMGRAVDVDHRTDIYSLAVTLYELMTRQPAITGQDRQEVLRQIANEEPTPPGRLEPTIPRELETIVLKAMSKEPQSRYATAQELADDLRRFLEHKPIRAKRPTLLERAGKWSRRHTAAVITAMLSLTIAAVGLAITASVIARERAEALRQRDRARQAVDDMYTDVAEQWLAQQASLEPMQRKFLEKALGYYQQFAGRESNDPGLRFETAVAYRRVGAIQEKLGNSSEAKSASAQAMRILEGLLAEASTDPQNRCELAMVEGALARLHWANGPQGKAEPLIRASISLLDKLAVAAPSEPRYRRELARSYQALGRVLRYTDNLGSVEALSQAIALLGKLATDLPSVPEYRSSLAIAHSGLAFSLLDAGRSEEEAERTLRRAVDLCEKLTADYPGVLEYRSSLGICLGHLGEFFRFSNRGAEAEPYLRRAAEVNEKVAAGSPSVALYQQALAGNTENLGILLRDTGREEEAEPLIRRAIALFEKQAHEAQSVPDSESNQADSHIELGTLLAQVGRAAEAEQEYRRAIALFEKLAGETPWREDRQQDVARTRQMLAIFLYRGGRLVEAEQEYRQVITGLAKLVDGRYRITLAWVLATVPLAQLRDDQLAVRVALEAAGQGQGRDRRHYLNILGVAHYRAGDWNSAIEALEKSKQLSPAGNPSGWFFLAMACCRKGEKEKARSWYDKGVQWMDRNFQWMDKTRAQDDELWRFRAEAAALLGVTDYSTPTSTQEGDARQRSTP